MWEQEAKMTSVILELTESQVLGLVRQLSPEARELLFEMLISELDVDWDETDAWEVPEAFLDDDQPWLDPIDVPIDGWGVSDFWGGTPIMSRRQLLAAETFHYSYAHYADHLGCNVRFDELMPDDVDTLERAEREGWGDARIAQALEIDEDKARFWCESYRRAKAIIDAPTPAEAFRRGVRFSIQDALEEGLADEGDEQLPVAIERLVVQICFRAADLGFLLDMTGLRLSEYSKELRDESAIPPRPLEAEDTVAS
jgi:hypothetical protein